jgi:TRAP-type C4-dicarboxylate transport system permease small subunit
MQSATELGAEQVRAHLSRISTVLSTIAGAGLVLLSVAITVDIVTRKFFHWSLQGTDELGGYVLALVAVFGFPFALLNRAHTRVDVLTSRMGARGRIASNVFAYATILLYAGFIGWYSVTSLIESLQYGAVANSPWQTPLWIPQGVTAFGSVFFFIVTAILFIQLVYLYLSKSNDADRIFSPPTADDELNEIVADIESTQAREMRHAN